jgi:hypothetical protein
LSILIMDPIVLKLQFIENHELNIQYQLVILQFHTCTLLHTIQQNAVYQLIS